MPRFVETIFPAAEWVEMIAADVIMAAAVNGSNYDDEVGRYIDEILANYEHQVDARLLHEAVTKQVHLRLEYPEDYI